MRMSHVYQSVMLRELLDRGGRASRKVYQKLTPLPGNAPNPVRRGSEGSAPNPATPPSPKPAPASLPINVFICAPHSGCFSLVLTTNGSIVSNLPRYVSRQHK